MVIPDCYHRVEITIIEGTVGKTEALGLNNLSWWQCKFQEKRGEIFRRSFICSSFAFYCFGLYSILFTCSAKTALGWGECDKA